jgi:hypothetical protein
VSADFTRRAPRRSAPSLEACVGGAATAIAGALFVLAALPEECELRTIGLPAAGAASPLVTAHVRPPRVRDVLSLWPKDTDLGNGAPGRRHQGAEGRMGSPRAARDHGLYGLKRGRDDLDPHLARERAEGAGRTAGALAVLSGSQVASLFGRDATLGREANDALGGLTGHQIEEGRGAGGLALVGTGPGGRGSGEGTIGLTSCGRIGWGGG